MNKEPDSPDRLLHRTNWQILHGNYLEKNISHLNFKCGFSEVTV